MNRRTGLVWLAKIFTLIILCCCGVSRSSAQSNRRISGKVTDTAKVSIPDAKVMIITGKDTLTISPDEYGDFSYSKLNADHFSIKVVATGYDDFKLDYSFADKEKHKKLDAIRLKLSGRTLQEVVVRAKPNPIRVMQDTVEYNAAAYRVEEGDNVADLLKQFPGMEVDGDYNVKVGEKTMTKLRVNGKDFFTNNVKDFIAKLPAGIVSKIQVIDDFGDEANFTGIKTGEPQKMLNIVTKPGMNKGAFGNAAANGGTNDMIGGMAQFNLWNDNKQSSANVNANTSNNGAGHSQQMSIGLNHSDKFGKNSNGGFGYNFNDNSAAFNREQVSEILNPEGNLTNHNQNVGDNKGSTHSLHWNMNFNNKKTLMMTGFNGSYGSSSNLSTSMLQQSGLLRQDLANSSSSNSKSPSANGNINISHKLKKNIISINASFSANGNSNAQHISTNTLYYDQVTGALRKDSLLKRDVDSKTNSRHLNIGFNYSFGLKRPKDTLARRSININYSGSAGSSANDVDTYVFDNRSNKVSRVDSLSNSFNSVTYTQSIGINYNYGAAKWRYNIGLNANAALLSNHDLRLGQTFTNNTINYAPSLNYGRTLALGKTLSLNYSGNTQSPNINQLQPIRNAQSLQNILVGNPDLKTSFSHSLSGNFNYVQKSGRSLMVGMNAATTQNEIVTDVTLLPDTLGSLKQVTRYENINGNYQVNGNYSINIPIKQNKFSVSYSGRMGFSNRAILFNHQKTSGKGANFSQQVSGRMSFKKLMVNAQLSYNVTNNNNTGSRYGSFNYATLGIGQIAAPTFFKTTVMGASLQGNLNLTKLRLNGNVSYSTSHNSGATDQVIPRNSDISLNLGGNFTIHKTWFTDFSSSKRINYGYAFPTPSPLLLNMGVGKTFLKNRSLSMSFRATDLLAQGNTISRSVSGNTVTDSRNLQPTRVFSLNLNYSLSQFGGRNFRVDPD
ncbi:TonB-dependent receptor [Mucilaginibacter mali]|uniref:TonB-dependent receptor n=1 Tax=Mucilaginibacter mali TaxID=2740462 RepID=A0A7D4QKZ4_9SPHI|nr:TonB-dependent receptor [Mucilaginibacter mali]QKJ30870.1 TonB-dependent receptor [Mucilaginibacter mali]